MLISPDEFEQEFSTCILNRGYERYYAIARDGSLTDATTYLNFLEENKLQYEIANRLDILKNEKIELIVKVKENSFDFDLLYELCKERLIRSKINLKLDTVFCKEMMSEFDIVVNCTYSNINFLLDRKDQVDYQFELCEKPIISIGKSFQGKSIVIMDGEFCCIDPFGFDGNYHVLGHVKEAIHDQQVGKFYNIPEQYSKVINNGLIKNFPYSAKNKMIEASSKFFNFKEKPMTSVDLGSMFAVRTVLPNRDHDDARPSYIVKHSPKLYSIFSGKIGTSVSIANQLTKMI